SDLTSIFHPTGTQPSDRAAVVGTWFSSMPLPRMAVSATRICPEQNNEIIMFGPLGIPARRLLQLRAIRWRPALPLLAPGLSRSRLYGGMGGDCRCGRHSRRKVLSCGQRYRGGAHPSRESGARCWLG